MSVNAAVWFATIGGVAVSALLLWWRGPRDILAYLAAYFAFFGLGPAVNHALGHSIYEGIVTPLVGKAALGVLLALAAMLAVGLLVPVRRTPLDRSVLDASAPTYPLAVALLWLLVGYALLSAVTHGSSLLAGDKVARLAAAGPGHYPYLVLELLACSLYFSVSRHPAGRIAYWSNMACYVLYCLATTERDFIFVLFSLLLHIQLFRRRTIALRLALCGTGLVVMATYLSSLRGGGPLSVPEILNQGSVTFVDTYIMDKVPAAAPFRGGQTYLDGLIDLVPFLPTDGRTTLANWLVATYAPGSASGYGFSLTGEAYLNFGLIGIPAVFAVLSAVQRLLIHRVERSDFGASLSVLFTISWMYAFRGESATMFRTLAYGVVLFAAVRAVPALRKPPTVVAPGVPVAPGTPGDRPAAPKPPALRPRSRPTRPVSASAVATALPKPTGKAIR